MKTAKDILNSIRYAVLAYRWLRIQQKQKALIDADRICSIDFNLLEWEEADIMNDLHNLAEQP